MRRSPFYAYPAYPFRTPHSNLYDHGPYHPEFPQQQRRRPSPPPSTPSQSPRSVIHVPVFDSASPVRPASPPQRKAPVVPLLDYVSAATRIQSYFRGYSIRKHNPLILLRNISASRKRLEDLKSELESPGFSVKVKSNERERLRFSESVMGIILQLDAIEGAIPEVRNQRKEATKMAIKLQDSMDAIMSPQEERTAAGSSDLAMDSETNLCFDVDAQQAATCSVPEEEPGPGDGITTMQEATATIQEEAADQVESRELEEQNAGLAEGADDVQEDLIKTVNGAGIQVVHDKERPAAQDDPVNSLNCVENDTFCSEGTFSESSEGRGIQAAGIDGTCLAMASTIAAPFKQADQTVEEEMSFMVVDGTKEPSSCPLGNSVPDKSCQTIDAYQEDVEASGQGSIISPGTPCAKEQFDAANSNMDDSSRIIDKLSDPQALKISEQTKDKTLTGVNAVSQDSLRDSDALHGEFPPSDTALLKQLSEECGQLKLMLGMLLAQNKAQSKVMCALGEKLEMLERQQKLGYQSDHHKAKRKMKKGSKRSVRYRNDDLNWNQCI